MNLVAVRWRASVWWIPAGAVAAALAIAWTGSNRTLFGLVNAWSRVTGPAPWAFVTILGDTAVAMALCLPLAVKRRDIAVSLAIAALVATLFVHGIKPVADTPRPPAVLASEEITVIGPGYTSRTFPSGHTTTIFVAAGLAWLYLPSRVARLAMLAVALAVGLSRIVVGVHWPLDVAAGAAGGWLSALAGARLSLSLPALAATTLHGLQLAFGLACAAALLAGLETGYPRAATLQYAAGAWGLLGAVYLVVKRAESACGTPRISR